MLSMGHVLIPQSDLRYSKQTDTVRACVGEWMHTCVRACVRACVRGLGVSGWDAVSVVVGGISVVGPAVLQADGHGALWDVVSVFLQDGL